jgi:hypothetical protein
MREEFKNVIGNNNRELIIDAREAIISSQDDHHRLITTSDDFFSLSTIRDLIFHTQEHTFTLDDIDKLIGCSVLEFCGFDNPQLIKSFKKQFPSEGSEYYLDNWKMYENQNSRAFAGMYQFWCQKYD